tara:strand:- start:10879 stop:11241 length:363 start_codon:yes stop_codon:yes gene_type:complete
MTLELITKHDGYEYAGIVCATICFLPQLYVGYKSGSLKDVSAASYWLIFLGSILWAIYMYENSYFIFTFATLFVTCISLSILCLKFIYYQKRVDSHFKSFDQPAPTLSIMTTSNAEENQA